MQAEGIMDPATIAAGVAALLAPYLKQIGEDFVGEAGTYVREKAKGLWQRLRAKLDGDPPAKVVLDRFAENPDAYGAEFTVTLTEKIAADEPLAAEISADVAEIKRKAPYVRVVQKMTDAEGIVGARAKRLKAGTVDVSQVFEKATNVIGADLDEIG
jgi:hypothetical protein